VAVRRGHTRWDDLVNGKLQASRSYAENFRSDETPVIIGGNQNRDSPVPDELLQGWLDDFRLYGRALSAAEVAALADP
jgi:hypothetical protein